MLVNIVRFDNDFEIESKYHLEYCVPRILGEKTNLQRMVMQDLRIKKISGRMPVKPS